MKNSKNTHHTRGTLSGRYLSEKENELDRERKRAARARSLALIEKDRLDRQWDISCRASSTARGPNNFVF